MDTYNFFKKALSEIEDFDDLIELKDTLLLRFSIVDILLQKVLLHESKTWAPFPLTSNSIQPHTTKAYTFRASDSG